jgi:Protein of unknown function (DUF4238)
VPTKRPHYVPKTYLGAWANSAGQVAYRRRDSSQAVVTNITNVAVAGGIYGDGELAENREEFFQQIEEEWAGLRRDLTTQGDLRGERRSLLSVFAAIQFARTLKHCEQTNFLHNVAVTTDERPIPKSAVRQYLYDLDGVEPDDAEVEAAWTFVNGGPGTLSPDEMLSISPNKMLGISMHVAVTQIAPRLEAMNWTVHAFGKPVLMSSDCPVHAWRRPTPEPHVGGIGIDNADEIRFPLSPSSLLVMTQGRQAASHESARKHRSINAEIFRQCHQFVIGTPQTKPVLDKLELSKRPPRLRFRTGPGYKTGTGGTYEYIGEVLHMYVE